MSRSLPLLLVALLLTSGHSLRSQAPRFPSHPDFKPTPEVPAMPKALMKLPRTPITRAKFPAIDFHLHGRELRTAEDYQKMIKVMDETGIGVICNMDGGFGADVRSQHEGRRAVPGSRPSVCRLDFNGHQRTGLVGEDRRGTRARRFSPARQA